MPDNRPDPQIVSSLIEALYAAAMGEQPWRKTLSLLAHALEMDHAALMGVIQGAGHPVHVAISSFMSDDQLLRYLTTIAPHDARNGYAARHPRVHLADDRDIIPEKEILKDPFFLDLMPTVDIQFGGVHILDVGTQGVVGLGLQNAPGRGFMTPEARMLMLAVESHAARAVRLWLRLREVDNQRALLSEILSRHRDGWIAVDREGVILYHNPAAKALSGLTRSLSWTASGHLRLVPAALDAEFRARLFASRSTGQLVSSTSGTPMALPTTLGLVPLMLTVIPLRESQAVGDLVKARALIHLSDPRLEPPDVARVQLALNLTTAEAGIALALLTEGDVARAAAKQNLTVGTARQYLKRVYQKVGVSGQVELVTRLLSL